MGVTEEIKNKFLRLNGDQQKQLLKELIAVHEKKTHVSGRKINIISNKSVKITCPHCYGTNVHKRGKQKGVQMYKCNDCGKWHSETSGTPLYNLKHKAKLEAYIELMEKGMSIKNIAKELNISVQTSFNWRHKLLKTLDSIVEENLTNNLKHLYIEIPVNFKGNKFSGINALKKSLPVDDKTEYVKIKVTIDNNGKKHYKVINDLTSSENSKETKDRGNKNKINSKEELSPIVKSGTDEALLKNREIHHQIALFLKSFNGVSSKYLQNYLNWHSYNEAIKKEL